MLAVVALLRDAAVVIVARGCPLAGKVVMLLSLALLVPENDFANAALIVAISEAGRLIADLGTETWSLRALVAAKSVVDRSKILSDALTLKTIAALLVIAMLWAVQSKFLPQLDAIDVLVVAILLLSSQIIGLVIGAQQAFSGLMTLLPILCVSYLSAVPISLLAASMAHDGTIGLLAFGVCETILSAFLLARLNANYRICISPNAPRSLGALVPSVAPIAALNIVVGLYSRLDIVAVTAVSSTAAATYSLAHRFLQPFSFSAAGLGSAIYARASVAASASDFGPASLVCKSVTTAFVAGSVGMTMLWTLGPPVVTFIYAGYPDSAGVLRTLAPLVLVASLTASLTGVLMGYGKFKEILIIACINLVCISVLLAWLAPLRGAIGAAEAMLLAESANLFMQIAVVYALCRPKPAVSVE